MMRMASTERIERGSIRETAKSRPALMRRVRAVQTLDRREGVDNVSAKMN